MLQKRFALPVSSTSTRSRKYKLHNLTLPKIVPASTHAKEDTALDKLVRRKASLTNILEYIRSLQESTGCGLVKRQRAKRQTLANRLYNPAERTLDRRYGTMAIQVPSRQPSQKNVANSRPVPGQPDRAERKLKYDHKVWQDNEAIIKVLEGYVAIERTRKKAVAAVKRKTDQAMDIFTQVTEAWDELIGQVEGMVEIDGDSSFNMQYAAYKIFADIFLLFRRTEKAIQVYKYATLLAEKETKLNLVVVMYGQIGYAYHILGEYEAAMYYYKKQLQLAWELGIKTVETNIYDNIGLEYYYLGDLEKSTYYHELSMRGGFKVDRSAVQSSPKSWENAKIEFRQEYLMKGGATSVSGEFIDQAFQMMRQAKYTQRMKYIKEKGFSGDLTKACIERMKRKLRMDLLPSPRVVEAHQREVSESADFSSCARNLGLDGFAQTHTTFDEMRYPA